MSDDDKKDADVNKDGDANSDKKSDIDYRIELGTTNHFTYINGYPDGTVRPINNITRAEVATIVYRLMTIQSRQSYYGNTPKFVDVAGDNWYITVMTIGCSNLTRALLVLKLSLL